jgi:hypothetical protein
MYGLASFCREAGIGENNGRRCPKHARTVFLPDLDSIMIAMITEALKRYDVDEIYLRPALREHLKKDHSFDGDPF